MLVATVDGHGTKRCEDYESNGEITGHQVASNLGTFSSSLAFPDHTPVQMLQQLPHSANIAEY
jgi:hypothetical protein